MFEPNTGCQLWIGTVTKSTGYGEIKVHGRKTTAHRAMWIECNGEPKPGMVVMHKCDVRLCVNPDHLSIGTRKENSLDMSKKERGFFNSLSPSLRIEMSARSMKSLGRDGLRARAAARSETTNFFQRSAASVKSWVTRRANAKIK